MSDPQPRQPGAANFEVPDLELEPQARSLANVAPVPTAAPAQGLEFTPSGVPERLTPSGVPERLTPSGVPELTYGTLDSFEPDSPAGQALSLELDEGPALTGATRVAETARAKGGGGSWRMGRAAGPTQLEIDPIQAAILADYGDSPSAPQLAPAYAYRVFRRQRELKRQLLAVSAECERARVERETALAELGSAVLAARGAVEVPSVWPARVRDVCERADQLIARRELQRAAITAYDRVRVAQGVRLACTAIGLLIVLIALNLAF